MQLLFWKKKSSCTCLYAKKVEGKVEKVKDVEYYLEKIKDLKSKTSNVSIVVTSDDDEGSYKVWSFSSGDDQTRNHTRGVMLA